MKQTPPLTRREGGDDGTVEVNIAALAGTYCGRFVGDGDDCDRVRMIFVPALIRSISRVCFRASVMNRWQPTSSLSGDKWIRSRDGFCDIISRVGFHTAGSRARKLLSFGALDNASEKSDVVASDDNRNLSSTVSWRLSA